MVFDNKRPAKYAAGALAASLVLALSGCGGNSLTKSGVAPSPYSDPAVEGLAPTAVFNSASLVSPFEETSGLGSPDGQTGYLTAAVDSDSIPIPAIAVSPSPSHPALTTIPLGFSTGGIFLSSQGGSSVSTMKAAQPGTPVIFRADISNGVDPGAGSTPPLVPSSIKLTSSDPQWAVVAGLKTDDPVNAPNGYLPMAFDTAFAKAPSGPLANGNYVTGTADSSGNLTGAPIQFSLPFTTSGLHNLRVTVADTRAVVHHTDFVVLVLAPGSAAILAQITDAGANPVGEATISLDSGVKTVTIEPQDPATPSTLDPIANPALTGNVLFVTTTGAHTITVTNAISAAGKPLTFTTPQNITLQDQQLYNTADTHTPFQITPG